MGWRERNREHTAMLQRLMRDPNYARHVETLRDQAGTSVPTDPLAAASKNG